MLAQVLIPNIMAKLIAKEFVFGLKTIAK